MNYKQYKKSINNKTFHSCEELSHAILKIFGFDLPEGFELDWFDSFNNLIGDIALTIESEIFADAAEVTGENGGGEYWGFPKSKKAFDLIDNFIFVKKFSSTTNGGFYFRIPEDVKTKSKDFSISVTDNKFYDNYKGVLNLKKQFNISEIELKILSKGSKGK